MRIRRLEIQAFGPFAAREVIDFEQLSAAGLFLLNGPTGAGKTSVLDAICFALYGSVPGARQDGRRLRSDHADPTTAPQVVCEFTASGRTIEVTRSPAWQRPSKRDTHRTTPEQASTQLREYIDGTWQVKSTRNDEAAQEITDLLGMNAKQFTKVVLLPQGDFAAFLRSSATERQELLQQLFGTDRFQRIEQQLAQDAATAREKMQAAEATVELLLRKAEDEAAKHLGAEGSIENLSVDGSGEDLGAERSDEYAEYAGHDEQPADAAARLSSWHATLAAAARTAAAGESTARKLAESTRLRATALKDQHVRHDRLRSVRALQTDVDAEESAQRERRERQRLHRAAEMLISQLDAADEADEAQQHSRSNRDRQLELLLAHRLSGSCLDRGTSADQIPPGLDLVGLGAAQTRLSGQLALLEDLLPQERQYQQKQTELAQAEQRAAEAVRAAADGELQITKLRTSLAELQETVEGHRDEAANIGQLRAELTKADEVTTAVAQYQRAQGEEQRLQREHHTAQEAHLTAKQRWLALLQERLEHAAAELAQGLAADAPCPVCGSCVHPKVASGSAAATAAEEEKAAHQAQEAALERLQLIDGQLREVQQDLAVLAAQGGNQPAEAATEQQAAAAAAMASAETALELYNQGKQQVQDTEQQQQELIEQCRQHAAAAAEANAEVTALQGQLKDLERKLETARGDYTTLIERVADLQNFARVLENALQALRDHQSAAAQQEKAARTLANAIAGSVFADAERVRAALLPPTEADALGRDIESHEAAQHRVRTLLAEPDVQQALSELASGIRSPDAADLKAAQEALAAAAQTAEDAAVERRLLETSVQQLATLQEELIGALAAAEPLRKNCELLSTLADLSRGAGENSYKMSLNTYVLAARLEQVAICATERLRTMTSGRYSLVYSDSRASRGARSGLGLHVLDEWTGQERDTSTLSGGESFMASLALALGLADVVQQESGGVDIETLFVDEGFGSLDEEALEQVMDALEGLRDGGRVVGLVSHVAEMKLRIPAQLQVRKTRSGSTLQPQDAGLVGA